MAIRIFDIVIDSPIGNIGITLHGQQIQKIALFAENEALDTKANSSHIIIEQFRHYFLQPHKTWLLDLTEQGSYFQKKVWQCLKTVPVGETRSYSDIAKILNTSPRSVANACRANPFAIVIPCHRIVSKLDLGGYYW